MYRPVRHSFTALSFLESSPGYSMHTQEGHDRLNESNEKVLSQRCDGGIPKRSRSSTHYGRFHPCAASQCISSVRSLAGKTRRRGVTRIARIASSPVSIAKHSNLHGYHDTRGGRYLNRSHRRFAEYAQMIVILAAIAKYPLHVTLVTLVSRIG